MRIFPLIAGVLAASPALAGPVCIFTEECYMTLECSESAYEVELDLDNDRLSTIVSNMDILHYHKRDAITELVAQGMGGLHTLTINGTRAILSVHIGAGPSVATYYGDCEAE